jgi:hypothetical protein
MSHSVHLIVGSSLIALGFLVMTCIAPQRRWVAVGLMGSVLHLIGVIRSQLYQDPSLALDLTGVALIGISFLWMLRRAITDTKRRHA